MQYRVIRTEDLEHGLFNKAGAKLGSTWDKHKYIAKQKVGDGYRYFYSQAELAAAKAKKAGATISNVAKSGVASVKRTASTAADSVKTGISAAKKNISDLRNYHTDVLNRYDRYAKEFSTRSRLHGEYYNTIHDPSTNPAKKHQAQAEIDANWFKMWNAHENELDVRREIGNKRYKKSLRLDKALTSVENFVDKGKSVASSLISNTKRISTETVNKGKAFVDYLANTTPKEIAGSIKSKIDGNIDIRISKRDLEAAKKNLVTVATVNTTIPHEVTGVSGAGRVFLAPASQGTGVIAGGPVRAVVELAGISDILSKSLGSATPINVVRATVEGLKSLETVEQVAQRRGKTVEELLG